MARQQEFAQRICDPEDIFSIKSIASAYKVVRKAAPWKASIQAYGANLFANAGRDSELLLTGKWKSSGFCEFDIVERGKPRHIRSVMVPEKCIQAALCNKCLVDLLGRSLIYDNGASLPGKGTEFALMRFKKHLRQHIRKHGASGYIYFFDFKHYFDSIPHDRLIDLARKKVINPRTMAIYSQIIREVDGGYGLGLGSQVSQISAIFYPNPVDHWAKDEMGLIYGRYMDDGYIIHSDREYLEQIAMEFERALLSHGIIPNKKKCRIVKLTSNFVFLKTRIFVTESGHIVSRISRETVTKHRRRLRKMRKLLDECRKPFCEINLEFFAWLCNLRRGKPYHIIVNAIRYFDSLFQDEGGFYIPSQRRTRFIKMIEHAIKEARCLKE